jgi:hypothetical protein
MIDLDSDVEISRFKRSPSERTEHVDLANQTQQPRVLTSI